MMTDPHRNPKIDKWLSDGRFKEDASLLRSPNQLTGLLISSQLGSVDFPEDVLIAWVQAIIDTRRTVDQSELGFVREARKSGWSWERVADHLGLPSAEAAERRIDNLNAELVRTHPTNIPRAYPG